MSSETTTTQQSYGLTHLESITLGKLNKLSDDSLKKIYLQYHQDSDILHVIYENIKLSQNNNLYGKQNHFDMKKLVKRLFHFESEEHGNDITAMSCLKNTIKDKNIVSWIFSQIEPEGRFSKVSKFFKPLKLKNVLHVPNRIYVCLIQVTYNIGIVFSFLIAQIRGYLVHMDHFKDLAFFYFLQHVGRKILVSIVLYHMFLVKKKKKIYFQTQ